LHGLPWPKSLRPAVAVVVGGLLISTVFTLILTPVVFSFGFGVTERLHAAARRWGLIVGDVGEGPSSEA